MYRSDLKKGIIRRLESGPARANKITYFCQVIFVLNRARGSQPHPYLRYSSPLDINLNLPTKRKQQNFEISAYHVLYLNICLNPRRLHNIYHDLSSADIDSMRAMISLNCQYDPIQVYACIRTQFQIGLKRFLKCYFFQGISSPKEL